MAATETATRATRALDALYRSHAGEVYRYAYAVLGNHADAEDVTQTTFVNALRALERGERPHKPSNWLITIAHNVVRQRFRTQKARPAEVELDHDIAVQEHTQDGPTIDELVAALQRIPPSQREALVMRELEGRSCREIQQILELTPTALEMLLFRARQSLAEELENVVTCEQAELAISRRMDGRLARKERRRLQEHLESCSSCARLEASGKRRRRAFGALALLPLPLSLTFFKGAPSASAATGLPTIGAGGLVGAGGGSVGTAGGLLASGMAVKAAALVAAVATAGAVGYPSIRHLADGRPGNPPAEPPARPGHSLPVQTAPHRADRTTVAPTRPRVAEKPEARAPAPSATPRAGAPAPTPIPARPSQTASQGEAPPAAETPAGGQQHLGGPSTRKQLRGRGLEPRAEKALAGKPAPKPARKAKKPAKPKKPRPAQAPVVTPAAAEPSPPDESAIAPAAAPAPPLPPAGKGGHGHDKQADAVP